MFSTLTGLIYLTATRMFKKGQVASVFGATFGINLANNGFHITLPLIITSLLATLTAVFLITFIQVTWKTLSKKSKKAPATATA